MLLQVIVSVFNIEYGFAQYLVLKGLEKTKIRVTDKERTALVDRLYRLRFDIKFFLSLLWLAILLIGLPLKFQIWNLEIKVWDLEFQLCLLKVLSSIFQFLAYIRGLLEGICVGLIIAKGNQILTNWFYLQQQKAKLYYSVQRCKIT